MNFPIFENEGTTTLIEGKRRQGKGIFQLLLVLPYLDIGYKGRANYWLKSPNYSPLTFYQFVCMLKNDKPFRPFIIVSLQEIHGWLNSHRSMSDNSEVADNLVFQASKLGINIVGDTQIVTRGSNSLREMANYRFEAEKDTLNNQFIYHEIDTSYPDDTVYTDEDFAISFKLASKFWHRYNTFQPSVPLGMGELLTKMEKHEPKLMFQTIERQTQLILDKPKETNILSIQDVTKIRVELALMKLEQDCAFSSYVVDNLKQRMS